MSTEPCGACGGLGWVVTAIVVSRLEIDRCTACNEDGKIDHGLKTAVRHIDAMQELWPEIIKVLVTAEKAFEVADMNMVEPEVGDLRICAEQANVIRGLLKKMRSRVKC